MYRNYDLRKINYAAVRDRGLSSQPAQHVIKKVADAYTTLRVNLRNGNYGKPGSVRRIKVATKPIMFRPDAAQPFDDRCLSWLQGEPCRSRGHLRGSRAHVAVVPQCGHTERANRPNQAAFVCRSCRVSLNADHNASLNIAARGPFSWGAVNLPDAA